MAEASPVTPHVSDAGTINPMAPASIRQYLVAMIVAMVLGTLGILAIEMLRPAQDNAALIATLLGFLVTATGSLLTFLKAQETHLSVNSRLEAFMRQASEAAMSKGLLEGRTAGREAADARTDALAEAVTNHSLKVDGIGSLAVAHDEWERGERTAAATAIAENTSMTRDIHNAVVPKSDPPKAQKP